MKTRFIDFLVLLVLLFSLDGTVMAGTVLTLDSDRLYDYAFKSYKSGEFSESASSFHSFIHFFPEDIRVEKALVLRGFSLFSLKKYAEAEVVFRTIFNSKEYGKEARNISGLMIASCFDASKERSSAITFMENWAASEGGSDPFLDRIKYETFWLYLSNDDRNTAEKRISEIKEMPLYRAVELKEELEKVPEFEKSPTMAGCLAVIPGGGFAYLGRYSDAFAAFVVNSALGAAAWQSFDNDMSALGGIISFVGAGFYLGGVYGSVSAAEKMNKRNRAAFYDSLRTRLYVKDNGIGVGFSIGF